MDSPNLVVVNEIAFVCDGAVRKAVRAGIQHSIRLQESAMVDLFACRILYRELNRNIRERSVVVIVVQPVFSVVRDVEIGPAVIVEVADRNAEAPAVIGYAGLFGNIREVPSWVVVKKCRVRWFNLSIQCIIGRATHDVDIEPPVVVVVQQRNSRSDGLEDVALLRRAHGVLPDCDAGPF